MANRLARESSPYLQLHKDNPVDWYPWGEEAFARARVEDKPIFLSVGYSTCYWCHVMERESFSDPEIARQLNEGFVCIKVDREERPDVDEIYMGATQLITRSGGWPNSLFLTPDLKPFYAGTYFPPQDAQGRPGFPRVLSGMRQAWLFRRAELLQQADMVAQAMEQQLAPRLAPGSLPGPELAASAQAALASRFDPRWGGFGRAPKFPSPANLFFLLERASADQDAGEMLVFTLDAMARGGLIDQLAGGFHRYATDEAWLVPHFEKMLYDNAALARLYAEAAPLAPEAGLRADRALHARLRAARADGRSRRLPLGDRRRDRRPRGRLLHLDRRRARPRAARQGRRALPRGPRDGGRADVRGRPLRGVPAGALRRAGRGCGRLRSRAHEDGRGAAASAAGRAQRARAPARRRQGPHRLERVDDRRDGARGSAAARAALQLRRGARGALRARDAAGRGRGNAAPHLARGTGERPGAPRRLRVPGRGPARPACRERRRSAGWTRP